MNIEIPSIFDDLPWDRFILRFKNIRKLRNKLTNLNYAHTTGILKKMIRFK